MIRAYAAQRHDGSRAQRARASARSARRRGARSRARLAATRRAVFRWVLGAARGARARPRRTCASSARGCSAWCGASCWRSARTSRAADGSPRRATCSTSRVEELFAAFDGAGCRARDLPHWSRARRAEFDGYRARAARRPTASRHYGPPAGGSAGPAPSARRRRRRLGARHRGGAAGHGMLPRRRARRGPHRARPARGARPRTGRILVAERTDPGWTLLFPAARRPAGRSAAACSATRRSSRARWDCRAWSGSPGLLDTLRRRRERSRWTAPPGVVRPSARRSVTESRPDRSASARRSTSSATRSVWEDADVLCEALAASHAAAALLSIASAGDNALALLTLDLGRGGRGGPEPGAASPASSCASPRSGGSTTPSCSAFLGVAPRDDRDVIYRALRSDAAARQSRRSGTRTPSEIATGVVHAGKFERYLRALPPLRAAAGPLATTRRRARSRRARSRSSAPSTPSAGTPGAGAGCSRVFFSRCGDGAARPRSGSSSPTSTARSADAHPRALALGADRAAG